MIAEASDEPWPKPRLPVGRYLLRDQPGYGEESLAHPSVQLTHKSDAPGLLPRTC